MCPRGRPEAKDVLKDSISGFYVYFLSSSAMISSAFRRYRSIGSFLIKPTFEKSI